MPYEKCANIEQANAIEELKTRMKNELTSTKLLEDDALFYKYLKAQDFNISKAEIKLRKHIVWRKVYDVDNILESWKPKEIILKVLGPSLIGYDKDGDLVIHVASGRIDNIEFFKCLKMNEYLRNLIWVAEKHKKFANQGGRKATISIIIDLDKLEFANATCKLTADAFLRAMPILRDNYAERLKSICIINAPSYYVFVFMLVKAVLPKSMTKRIHVFGQGGWREKLLEAIDADVLPAFLGGKLTDPDGDPYCRSFVWSFV